jgi:TRAP-type C4-dicarboxylate transport system permease small subunit
MPASLKRTADIAYRAAMRACSLVAWAALLGLSIAVFVGVFDRFILAEGFAWPEAIGRALLIWLSLIGAALAAERRGHFAAGIIPPGSPFARGMDHVVRIVSAIILLYLSYSAFEVMEIVGGQEMAGIELSIMWIYVPLPIACFLMAIASVKHGISGDEQG